jgi:hypothetical protein
MGLLWTFSPLAVLVLLLAALPAAAGEMRFSRAAFRLRNFRAPETRRLNYIEYILGSDEHAKEVMVLGSARCCSIATAQLGESLYRDDRSAGNSARGLGLSAVAAGDAGVLRLLRGDRRAGGGGRISLGEMTLYVVAFRQRPASVPEHALAASVASTSTTCICRTCSSFWRFPRQRSVRWPPRPRSRATRSAEALSLSRSASATPARHATPCATSACRFPPVRAWRSSGTTARARPPSSSCCVGLYQPTEGRISSMAKTCARAAPRRGSPSHRRGVSGL